MENRFGIKDFFLFGLIALLAVVLILAMVMFDRQYQKILSIESKQNQLIEDLERLRKRGVIATTQVAESTTIPEFNPDGNRNPMAMQLFAGVAAAEKLPNFKRGGTLNDDFGSRVKTLTPLIGGDVNQAWVEALVMESLASRDHDSLDMIPRLANRWDISPDGKTMRFFLRTDVSFSDGTPLTGEDVVYTFEFIRNPDIRADRERSSLTELDQVKLIDKYTVEFTFKNTYYNNLVSVAGQSVFSKKFLQRFTTAEYNEKTGLMLGTGPFQLESPDSWTPGQPVVLVRNARYWGVQPTLDKITFGETDNEFVNYTNFINGDNSFLRCTPPIFEQAKANAELMSRSYTKEYNSVYGGYRYIGWNQARRDGGKEVPTRFADKRIRQAMTMLLDRERMTREIMLGYATVSSGPFAPTGKQTNPDIKPWPFDLSRAKALLKEAGYEDRNGDGVIENAAGEPFKFTLTYPSGSPLIEKTAIFVQDSYRVAGIVVEMRPVDWSVLQEDLKQRTFDAIHLGWSATPESDPYQIFHSSQTAGEGDNRMSYRSPEVDKLIEQARLTMDTPQRMKLWHQVHAQLHDDQPYTFLYAPQALRVFNNSVQNVGLSSAGLNYEFLNGGAIPWFVTTEKAVPSR
jgi:peptide/nickel transport system substrate-binding protein